MGRCMAIGGRGVYFFVARLTRLSIDHATLSRRSVGKGVGRRGDGGVVTPFREVQNNKVGIST